MIGVTLAPQFPPVCGGASFMKLARKLLGHSLMGRNPLTIPATENKAYYLGKKYIDT